MVDDKKRVYERILLENISCDNRACRGFSITKRVVEKGSAFRRIVVLKCFDCGRWLATVNDDLEATQVLKWQTNKGGAVSSKFNGETVVPLPFIRGRIEDEGGDDGHN